jgi:hypothetical protein
MASVLIMKKFFIIAVLSVVFFFIGLIGAIRDADNATKRPILAPENLKTYSSPI